MNKILFASIFVCLAVFGNCQIDLRLNLKNDSTYYAELKLSTVVIQTFLGVNDTTTTESNANIAFEVVDKPDSLYRVKMRFLNFREVSKHGADATIVDSDGPDTITNNLILKLMLNQPVDIKMNEVGDIVEMKNSESLFAEVLNKFHFSEETKKELVQQIKKIMESDISDGSMDLVTSMYPDKPVETEEPWEVFSKSNTIVPSTLKTVYEIKEVTDEGFLLVGSGNITTDPKEIVSEGTTMKFRLEGTVKATAKIDALSKWIRNAEINQTVSGTVDVKEPQSNEFIPIPMKIITQISFKGK